MRKKIAIFIGYAGFMDEGSSTETLQTIVYASAETAPMTAVALHSLLTKARAHNRRNGITGMLVYAEGNFMQVIEGPREALDATLRRIHTDQRHTGIIELFRGSIKERAFGEWSMGYRRAEGSLEGLVDFSKEKLNAITAEHQRSEVPILLKNFFQSTYPYTVL
ncbi:MAG: BLUF domain-containing protein [Pseudomonadota bacterium]